MFRVLCFLSFCSISTTLLHAEEPPDRKTLEGALSLCYEMAAFTYAGRICASVSEVALAAQDQCANFEHDLLVDYNAEYHSPVTAVAALEGLQKRVLPRIARTVLDERMKAKLSCGSSSGQ